MLEVYYGHIQLLENQRVFDKWLEKMNLQRREKVLRCKNEEDQRRSLLAGILLYLGVKNNQNKEEIFYSISHSGDYVTCVISNRKVGIDIENKFRSVFSEEKGGQLEKITKKCLTFGEKIHFEICDDHKKSDLFLQYWTRKESYSKAIGKGLGIDFSTIDTEKMDDLYWSDWLKEGYYCSLYVENGKFSDLKIQEIDTLQEGKK